MVTSQVDNSLNSKAGVLERPRVVFDGGNRSIQWIDADRRVHCIPSFIKYFDPEWEDVQPDSESVVIEFEDQHFVIGAAAKDMSGIPVFQDDKIAIARHLALVALQPNGAGQKSVRIDELMVALPNSRSTADSQTLKGIEGTYGFMRNGQYITATVRKVVPVDETRAAYQYAMRRDVFLSKLQLNGVLDLGGGTSIARLYSKAGSCIREADVQLPGTFSLASMISARLTRTIGSSPDLTLIMDGIEDGSFKLGTSNYTFNKEFDLCRQAWLDSIKGEIKTRWNSWLNQLGEVLIIGGSAPLAEPLQAQTEGRFKIAENPQTISILGMTEVEV